MKHDIKDTLFLSVFLWLLQNLWTDSFMPLLWGACPLVHVQSLELSGLLPQLQLPTGSRIIPPPQMQPSCIAPCSRSLVITNDKCTNRQKYLHLQQSHPKCQYGPQPRKYCFRYTQGWNDCLPLHKVAGFQLISTAVRAEAFETSPEYRKQI